MFPHASRLTTSTAAFAVIGAFALALALVSCRPSAPDKSSSAAPTQPPSASVQSTVPATPAPPAGNNASGEAGTKDPCSEAETQADLTACWTRAAAEARSRATMTYARANDWLAQRGQAGAQQRLKQAQSSWDRYRSTYCEAVAAVYEGGSVAGTQKAHCEATLDTQYADQLTTLMNDASGP